MDDQAVSSAQFDETDIYWAMWEALCEIHGDYGAGAAKQSLSVKVCNCETATAVVRISRDSLDMLANSLCFVRKVGKHPAVIRSLHLGGSMRSCERALLKIHRKRLVASLPKATTLQMRRDVQKAIMVSCGGGQTEAEEFRPPDND